MSTQPVLQVQNLSLEYRLASGWHSVIYDVSMTIPPLGIYGLVGESGSGKTTLALALMRYLAPNARIVSGRVLLDGDDLLTKSDAEMRQMWGRDLTLVPQDPLASLNPAYTVGAQLVEVIHRHERVSARAARAKAVEMLRRVKISDPEVVVRRFPHQLSGGMQQRVMIAMALATRPRLLVLDEPTTALDVTTQAVILDLIRELVRENAAAALYVSHDLGVVAQLCDHVTVLYGGEVMATAPVGDIYARPLHPYTIGLLASLPRPTPGVETRLPTIEGVAPSLAERPTGCVFANRCPAALPVCFAEKPPLEVVSHERLVKCHRWREIADGSLILPTAPVENAAAPLPAEDGNVFVAESLNKRYRETTLLDQLVGRQSDVQAVDNVSLHIRRTLTLGLVGESGSGKTTLARCLVGLNQADSGSMELLDMALPPALSRRTPDMLRALQMVFQNPNDALNPYQTVGTALARTIRRLSPDVLSRSQVQERVDELLNAVRLSPEYAHRYPAELSGGEKQRVAIARAFAAHPALVVADEPVSSLDVSVQAVILNLLKDLRAGEGVSYLLISHDLEVVGYLADWIAVMYLGEIVEEGDVDAVFNSPSHPYTEALISAIPVADPSRSQGIIRLDGDVPSARHIPSGCRFHTRCPRKLGAICEQEAPPWRDAGGGHFIRCHIPIETLTELQTPERAEAEV